MSFVPGTGYYIGIDEIGGLSPGDVLILEEGTSVAVSAIPDGITIRGRAGKRATTILECADLAVGAFATIRGLTIRQTGGDAALAATVDAGMRWVEDCVFESGTIVLFEQDQDWTFAKCVFAGGNAIGMDVGATLHMYGCLFGGSSQVTNTFNDVYIYNNTFLGMATSTVPAITGGGSSNINKIYNNVFALSGADTALIDNVGGTDTIYGNWSTYNLGNASWGTVVTDLKLRANGYPTNESPVRIAATPQAGDSILDLNYLPYATSGRSAGCYQWSEDTSALYVPRYVDPLDGLALDFDSATLDLAPGRLAFYSHLELAAYVRSYVNDLMHPSFGVFHTTVAGAYRLRTIGDLFDLTISGESATVFGAQTLTNVDDTD